MYICNINCVKDEFHFLLVRHSSDSFRKKYIKTLFFKRSSMFKFVKRLRSENLKIMNNLRKYTNNS